MRQIFSKRFLTLLTLLCCTLFLTSCDKLRILIYTKINPDGSANRRVEYVLSPSDVEELKYIYNKLPDLLEKAFVMPIEPEWKVKKLIKDGAFHYIAEKKFNSINDLKFDYYKISQYVGASRNYISFDLEDKTKSQEFSFMEIYRDSSDIVKFSHSFAVDFEKNKKSLISKLYEVTHPIIADFNINDADKIVSLFLDRTKRFEGVVKSFDIIGPREVKIIENELIEYNKDVEIGRFIDYLMSDDENIKVNSELIKLFRLNNKKIALDKKKALFEKLKSILNDEFKSVAVANNIDPLGAFYTNLDMLNTYSFEYTIEMPGDIVKSNGNRVGEHKVQWIFEPEDFFNHDYMIMVRSSLDK